MRSLGWAALVLATVPLSADGKNVDWLEKASDEQYLAGPTKK